MNWCIASQVSSRSDLMLFCKVEVPGHCPWESRVKALNEFESASQYSKSSYVRLWICLRMEQHSTCSAVIPFRPVSVRFPLVRSANARSSISGLASSTNDICSNSFGPGCFPITSNMLRCRFRFLLHPGHFDRMYLTVFTLLV